MAHRLPLAAPPLSIGELVESFWGKLKTGMVYHERFATKAQALAAVFEYIEMFYNRKRLHAALDYLSPEQFEARRAG